MDYKNLFLNYLKSDDIDTEKVETCLISNEPLLDNHIVLDCTHKFNFIELYNEVIQQKTKNILDNSKLRLNEIKCPYCRNVTNKLLPYLKYYNNKLIRGVNSPQNLCLKMHECHYINARTKVKCSNSACNTNFGKVCNNHLKYTKNQEEILENVDINTLKFYKKKTVKVLKEELKELKGKISGKKEDLVNRLLINKYIYELKI